MPTSIGTVIHGNEYGGGTLIDTPRDLVGGYTPYYATPFTSTTGASKPFNIRDPYVVWKACKQKKRLEFASPKRSQCK